MQNNKYWMFDMIYVTRGSWHFTTTTNGDSIMDGVVKRETSGVDLFAYSNIFNKY